jgi:cell division protein FtsW (lipid II flippase)
VSIAAGTTATLTAPSAPPRRRVEVGLLLIAVVITTGAYALVSLGRTADLPTNLRPFVGVIAALLLLGHVANRVLAKHADASLFPVAGMLNGIGYVIIARLEPKLANRQAAWTAIAIVAYVLTLTAVRSTRRIERLRYTFALIGVMLLLLPLVPGIGREINGSRIWVGIGPISFQPGELAKITLALYFASYLVDHREVLAGVKKRTRLGRLGVTLPELRHAGPIALMWAVSLMVMFYQKDLGSSLLFFTLFVVMVWLATGRPLYLIIGSLMFALGSFISWMAFAHVQRRVRVWIDPWPEASKAGYQIVQSLYAFGSGGVGGTGLALGSPTRIPYASTDFIFAVIGEELGFVGTTAVLAAFLLLIGAGLRIARRATRPFDQLLAAGLTTIIGVQTFVIVGGVTRLVPLTGVTLPFVSYGGSSLVINYVLIALLVRISHENNQRDLEVDTEEAQLADALGGRTTKKRKKKPKAI